MLGMRRIEVGGYIDGEPRMYQEGIKFDFDDSGCVLIAFFNRPTNEEVQEFKQGKIKLGYHKYKNVLMMLAKIGNLSWMDAPYSVHLSNNLTHISDIEEGMGLATTVMLVDASNGEIKTLRLVGANHRLSCSLVKDIKAQKEMSFDNYYNNMNYLFGTYSTKELVNRAIMIENMSIKK